MAVQFAMLASGSRGNAALIRGGGAGLLIDLGLGPRLLADRLNSVGSSWEQVGAVLITHTHGDHIDEFALGRVAKLGITLYCHEGQRPALERFDAFRTIEAQGALRYYDDRPFLTPSGWSVEPVELSHDGGPTYGFRVQARDRRRGGRSVGIGYMADTGCWTHPMADLMTDVDVLGVEFNHDIELQRNSGRHPALIRRNLSNRGHLSNRQGAEFLGAVLDRSGRGAVRHVVLLHLSDQCNRPDLALKSARSVVRQSGRRVMVHTASQDPAHPNLWLEPARRRAAVAAPRPAIPEDAWLPF